MGLALFHHHPVSGMPCNCPFGRPKFLRRTQRVAGPNWNRALKNDLQGKKFKSTPGADVFVDWMKWLMAEDPNGWRDEIAPLLVKEFRQGRLTAEQGTIVDDTTGATLSDYQVDRLGRWAAARQHPTRRGVNITGPDFTLQRAHERSSEFYRDMEERERIEEQRDKMRHSDAPSVYDFPDGWSVRDLAHARDTDAEMELEGDVMNHCIGNESDHPFTGYSYRDAVRQGDISHVYSLRDPEGIPHATWHHNADDDSLAEIHGYGNQPGALNKYAPRIAHFLRERHPSVMSHDADSYTPEDMRNGQHPWFTSGNQFTAPDEYDSAYNVDWRPATMADHEAYLRARHHGEDRYDVMEGKVDPEYWDAINHGEDPDLIWDEPDHDDIAADMVARHHSGDPERSPVNDHIRFLHNNHPGELDDVHTFVDRDDPLYRHIHDQRHGYAIEDAVRRMYPGVRDPQRLFVPHDTEGSPPNADSYGYQVTDPRAGMGEGQYLNPADKRYFMVRNVKTRMKAMRDEGASWADVHNQHRMGVLPDESPEHQAMQELRDAEYEETRQRRRNLMARAHNGWAANLEPDVVNPAPSMQDLQNHVRRYEHQNMVMGGLTPDQASQRIIEYEREMRQRGGHCPECGDYNGQHTMDCPRAQQEPQAAPAGPAPYPFPPVSVNGLQQPPPGTFSSWQPYEPSWSS